MSNIFRILLFIAALIAFVFMISSIRKSKFVISDSIYWFFFGLALLILGLFPEIGFSLARALGVMSSTNLIFLIVIALLVLRVFQMELKLANLNNKFRSLVQDLAIKDLDEKEDNE